MVNEDKNAKASVFLIILGDILSYIDGYLAKVVNTDSGEFTTGIKIGGYIAKSKKEIGKGDKK